MNKITPFLWFDNNLEEALNFYASIFKDSHVQSAGQFSGMATFAGQDFMALNGGPMYKFTPAISFFVDCESEEEIYALWSKLSEGGEVLMEYQKYPFAEKFGWVNDRFGLSWQLKLSNTKQTITPFIMFFGDNLGKAQEAIDFYVSEFPDSHVDMINHHESDSPMGAKGHVQFAKFNLAGQSFLTLDSAAPHKFDFTEAISFYVNCDTQEEINMFWDRLIANGGSHSQCGWLKDRFGVSWQIIPSILPQLLSDPARAQRVMGAMMKMQKLDIEGLKNA